MKQHKMSGTPTHKTWDCMKQRCKGGGDSGPQYVAKGITYPDSWEDFRGFLADMGERPEGCTLDRIDNTKGYSKENCRWATPKEQGRNRDNNRVLSWRGETRCVSEWAEVLGIKVKTLQTRLHRGWSTEDALGRIVALK